MQFARKSSATNGQPGPLPEFGATRGQEITKGLLGIEASFESHVDRLRRLDYDILDVKISRWHDDHNIFKNQVSLDSTVRVAART
jgi:dynein heavy chain